LLISQFILKNLKKDNKKLEEFQNLLFY